MEPRPARTFSGPTWRDVTEELEKLRSHFGGHFSVGMDLQQSRFGNLYQYWQVRWAPTGHECHYAWRRGAGGNWSDPAYQSVPDLLLALCRRLRDAMEAENRHRTRQGLLPLGHIPRPSITEVLSKQQVPADQIENVF